MNIADEGVGTPFSSMVRLWAICALAGCVALAGCAALVPVAGGGALCGGAAWLVTIETAEDDVDLGLRVAKPLTTTICVVERKRPHGAKAQALIAAFCDHLPDDTAGLLLQAAAVVDAIKEEQRAG